MSWLSWESRQPSSLSASLLLSQTHIPNRSHLVSLIQKRQALDMKESTENEIRFPRSSGYVNSMTLDKIDERFLLCGSSTNEVLLYDMRKAERRPLDERGTISPLKKAKLTPSRHGLVSAVDWFPNDCGIFIAASIHDAVSLFDASCFQSVMTFSFGENKRIFEAKFRPACAPGLRTVIGVALEDGEIALCDVRTGDSAQRLRAHTHDTTALDWNPLHEHQLLSASRDGTVKVWDIRRGGNATPVLTLDWTEDKGFVAPHSAENTRDQRQHWLHHQVHRELSQARAHECEVMSARFTPCGARIITSAGDGLRLWSSRNGALSRTKYSTSLRRRIPYRLEIASFTHPADDLLVLPNFSSSSRGQITRHVVSLLPVCSGTGKAVKELCGHWDEIVSVVYARHSQRLISASADGMVLEWRGDDKVIEGHEPREEKSVTSFSFPRAFCERQSGLWMEPQYGKEYLACQNSNRFNGQSRTVSVPTSPPNNPTHRVSQVKSFNPVPAEFIPPILLQLKARKQTSDINADVENNATGYRKIKRRRLMSVPSTNPQNFPDKQ